MIHVGLKAYASVEVIPVLIRLDVRNKLHALYDFFVTVKAAFHECVIRNGQPQTEVKAEIDAMFIQK